MGTGLDDGSEPDWWFCLKHQTVEHGAGCPGRLRLGPYRTREDAARALETVQRRNEEWDAQDDER